MADRLARCFPSSPQVVQATAGFLVMASATVALFSKSLFGVCLSVPLIVMSLEAIYSVSKGDRWFLSWFALYNLAHCVACIGVGAYILANLGTECAVADNPDVCTNTQVLFGVLLSLGSASASAFASITSGLAYFSMREKQKEMREKQREIDRERGGSGGGVLGSGGGSSGSGGLFRSASRAGPSAPCFRPTPDATAAQFSLESKLAL